MASHPHSFDDLTMCSSSSSFASTDAGASARNSQSSGNLAAISSDSSVPSFLFVDVEVLARHPHVPGFGSLQADLQPRKGLTASPFSWTRPSAGSALFDDEGWNFAKLTLKLTAAANAVMKKKEAKLAAGAEEDTSLTKTSKKKKKKKKSKQPMKNETIKDFLNRRFTELSYLEVKPDYT